jgi:hypothetical protein
MNPRSVRYAIAACAGLAAPALMIAAKGTLAAVFRPPSVRIASFLDPTHVHRDLVTMSLDVLVAAALGVALGAMVTRVTGPQLWRGWCVFIVAFLACSTLMIVLRARSHARNPFPADFREFHSRDTAGPRLGSTWCAARCPLICARCSLDEVPRSGHNKLWLRTGDDE